MDYQNRFSEYFRTKTAENAAKSLSSSARIELRILSPENRGENSTPLESFYFAKINGRNEITSESENPDVTFSIPTLAADEILTRPVESVGQAGIEIAKLIFNSNPQKKVRIQIHKGFLGLFRLGYFGVVKSGGGEFARFLASRGLGNIKSIKTRIAKLRESHDS